MASNNKNVSQKKKQPSPKKKQEDSKKKNSPLKDMKTRTKFTLIAMFNIVWYTVVVLIANFMDHDVQAELTVAWFSAWTVELALLFGIKVTSKDSVTSQDWIDEEPTDDGNETDDTVTTEDDSSEGVG